jgi:hypothetical protein
MPSAMSLSSAVSSLQSKPSGSSGRASENVSSPSCVGEVLLATDWIDSEVGRGFGEVAEDEASKSSRSRSGKSSAKSASTFCSRCSTLERYLRGSVDDRDGWASISHSSEWRTCHPRAVVTWSVVFVTKSTQRALSRALFGREKDGS